MITRLALGMPFIRYFRGTKRAQMPTRRRRITLGLFWLLVAGIGAHPAAFANVTYTYTGKPYTSFARGFTCPSGCGISATLVFASRLPPNLGTPDFGGQRSVYVTPVAFSITDGQGTITEVTQFFSGFRFVTDSSGNIIEWLIYAAGLDAAGFGRLIQSRSEGLYATVDITEIGANGGEADNGPGDIPGTWTMLGAPTNLKAAQVGYDGTQIQLTWDYTPDLNNPIDGFNIYRKTPSGSWPSSPTAQVAYSLAPYGYNDNVPIAFATYTYRVSAYKGTTTESDFSNESTAFQLRLVTENCPPCTILSPWPAGQGTDNTIVAFFHPDAALPLNGVGGVADKFGYDHFNWISNVMSSPVTLKDYQLTQVGPAPPPFLDPPLGGWDYFRRLSGNSCPPVGPTADFLPYVYDELPVCVPSLWLTFNTSPDGKEINFNDHPGSSQLGPSDYMQFVTTLVGVKGALGTSSTPTGVAAFSWSTNNHIASINLIDDTILAAPQPPNIKPISGGIFNVQPIALQDLPTAIRQSLIQAGVHGISAAPKVDKDAPATVALLSGSQGNNGWYTGPVTVTLIATDIDGPSDIAATHYQLDGGLTNNYTGAFIVPSDGTHTIQFGSVDKAGNVETPSPSVSVKIDATPPVIKTSISGTQGNNGWYRTDVTITWTVTGSVSGIASSQGCASTTLNMETAGTTLTCTATSGAGLSSSSSVTVKIDKTAPVATAAVAPSPNANGWTNANTTVSFAGTDSISGIDSCSAPVTLTNEGAGQTATGTCTDKAGNVSAPATATVNIDRTAPIISGMPAAGCTLWPPDQKLVTVATVTGADALAGLAPGSFNVTGTSNEPATDSKSADILITPNGTGGFVIQLRADRLGSGNGRIYTLNATASDLAGNTATVTASCTVPHDQGNE
jgi:hypothetical protein